MSVFTDIAKGLSKATNFILTIFTKTESVVKTFESLSPQVQAAMLATFYDVAKTVTTVGAATGAAEAGAIPTAFTLSETTLTLLSQVKTDVEQDVTVVKSDLTALGIL